VPVFLFQCRGWWAVPPPWGAAPHLPPPELPAGQLGPGPFSVPCAPFRSPVPLFLSTGWRSGKELWCLGGRCSSCVPSELSPRPSLPVPRPDCASGLLSARPRSPRSPRGPAGLCCCPPVPLFEDDSSSPLAVPLLAAVTRWLVPAPVVWHRGCVEVMGLALWVPAPGTAWGAGAAARAAP